MPEIPWRSVAALEGLTDDKRWYKSLSWRDLPLAFTAAHEDSMEDVVGRVDTFEKHAGGVVISTGVFIDTPEGAQAAELVRSQAMRGQSVEVLGDYEWVCTAYQDFGYGPECVDGLAVFEEATIVASSLVTSPAFAAAQSMELVPAGETDADAAAAIERMVVNATRLAPPLPSETIEVVTAALAWAVPGVTEIPLVPSLAWFERPEPDELVPLHMEPDGSVFGHVAPDGECHIGYTGRCVTPPTSPSAYANYNLGRVVAEAADGTMVAVRCGQVTMTTGHMEDSRAGINDTVRHYDHTGFAVADVVVSAGRFGPYACGAARSTITPEQIREFNAAKPSGDWRPLPGGRGRDLVAVLMVNTPGFPVVASGGRVDESGDHEGGLVIGLPSYQAWRKPTSELAEVRARLARIEGTMETLVATVGPERMWESLAASIEG